jgi:hypothetical protein
MTIMLAVKRIKKKERIKDKTMRTEMGMPMPLQNFLVI